VGRWGGSEPGKRRALRPSAAEERKKRGALVRLTGGGARPEAEAAEKEVEAAEKEKEARGVEEVGLAVGLGGLGIASADGRASLLGDRRPKRPKAGADPTLGAVIATGAPRGGGLELELDRCAVL